MAGSPGGEISTHLFAAAFPGSGDKANVLTAISAPRTTSVFLRPRGAWRLPRFAALGFRR